MKSQKVAVVGYGRFGQLLADLLKPQYDTAIVETDPKLQAKAKKQGFVVVPLELLSRADVIFLAVPIAQLEGVLQQLAPLVGKDHVVMDLCSVKVYPAALLKRYLPNCQTIATHPLFGPDSANGGLRGLKLAVCPLNAKASVVKTWTDFWKRQGVEVIKTTPEAHDKDTAYSQAFTYSLARLILSTGIPDLTFTTKSYQAIKQVADLSAKDTEQLFHDMLYYNPYFKDMRAKLESAATETLQTLDAIAKEQTNIV